MSSIYTKHRDLQIMEYKHFSHEHNLSMYQVQPGQQLRCSGCDKFCDKTIYACWQCNFFLHEHCGNATRYIKHPSHSSHYLILSPYPTYPSNCFLCNACGTNGLRFSYCCALCEVDLHVNCAFLPPKVAHKAHPHELVLNHTSETGVQNQVCKMCRKPLDSKHWSYECLVCANYGVHTLCATNEIKMGLYQMDDGSDIEPSDQGAPTTQPAASTGQQGSSDGQAQVKLTPMDYQILLHMGLDNGSSYV
ncbi:putative chromatin regulator PHD family [Helianthus annuus]|nr:putative chromatin regulator PHD family [Helianthus annuus]KAJ0782512.1 putative chromatin regulator PHD family [Helianthus annuus]KAJ0956133.1 putative chromatin regulator PHD family [Helianthus annuus]